MNDGNKHTGDEYVYVRCEGEDAPNKKYYDPRVWLRKMEDSIVKRLEVAFDDLNCRDVL